jgi:preprotein translocase subunit YajC
MSLLDFLISPAAAAPAAANPAAGSAMSSMFLLLVMVAMFGFIFWSQHKRQKEHRKMVSSLQKGDEIISSGGIAGRVEEIGENFLTIEVAEGVRIRLQKGAINAVLPKGTLKSA